MSGLQPMLLLADSQLLFWKESGEPFLARVRRSLEPDGPRERAAAYLGASNGDVRDYYDIFAGAMAGIDVTRCRMIPSSPAPEDRAFLDAADVILLAGGDVARGQRVFDETGMGARVLARYAAGAALIGISAGAVQLGQRGSWPSTLGLAPVVIGVHEEPDWAALAEGVRAMGEHGRGLGIPLGGGAIVHADLTVEPVRKPLVELAAVEGVLRRSLLVPP